MKAINAHILTFQRTLPIALARATPNDLLSIDLNHLTHALKKEMGMRQASCHHEFVSKNTT